MNRRQEPTGLSQTYYNHRSLGSPSRTRAGWRSQGGGLLPVCVSHPSPSPDKACEWFAAGAGCPAQGDGQSAPGALFFALFGMLTWTPYFNLEFQLEKGRG